VSSPSAAAGRQSPRELATAVVVGVVLAVVAAVATAVLAGGSGTTFTATAQLAQIPGRTLAAGDVPQSWDTLGGGSYGKAAASVYTAPRWRNAAATAVGLPSSSVIITAGLLDNTSLIAMTAEAPTAQAAQKALQTVIDQATPLATQVAGPYDIIVAQAPTPGTATGVPASQLAIGAAVLALVLGTGLTLAAQGRRRDRELAQRSSRPSYQR
jgi:hypothetical protein